MKLIIMHGDCVDKTRSIADNSIDAIFNDPPYGTGNKSNKTPDYDQSEYMATRNWQNFFADWDGPVDPVFTELWLREAQRVLKPHGSIWICGTFHNIPITALILQKLGFYTIQWVQWCIPNSFPHLAGQKMANANQTLIWARKCGKQRHVYMYERAKSWNAGKNLRDYWEINNDGSVCSEMPFLRDFPAKKPRKLIARALDISLPDDRPVHVLDMFAGSGTTGDVCRSINRWILQPRQHPINCTLIEKDRAHIDRFIIPRFRSRI